MFESYISIHLAGILVVLAVYAYGIGFVIGA
jgi:hypothetical protein